MTILKVMVKLYKVVDTLSFNGWGVFFMGHGINIESNGVKFLFLHNALKQYSSLFKSYSLILLFLFFVLFFVLLLQ